MTQVSEVLAQKRVIVCCGAGGVGKTTVSASLALAAARAGRRVLVVTIDPSRRLAETLGVSRNLPEPAALPAERLAAAGVHPPGSLSAWMLDPQLVSDRVVRGFSKSEEDAHRLLSNPIYQNVTAMVAGMQEYTAVEALHDFVRDDHYDLVVLDTPPSRNALRFLEAPHRAGAFLDRRVFNLFIPGEGSVIRRFASRLIERVMDVAFGEETRQDLQTFFQLFGALLGHLNHNQTEMRAFFTSDQVGFLLVTSPAQEALAEAQYFERKTRDELGLPLIGYVLNRSLASFAERPFPDPALLPTGASQAAIRAVSKLAGIAKGERRTVEAHVSLADDLSTRTDGGVCWVLPHLTSGASDLDDLLRLTAALTQTEG